MTTALVTLEHVTFGYGGPAVLKDVDHSVLKGAFTGVVGPSGSGKTSLLRRTTAARHGHPSPRRRRLLRPPARDRQLELPGHRRRVRRHGPTDAPAAAWATREEKAEVAAVLDRLGIADLADRHIRERPT